MNRREFTEPKTMAQVLEKLPHCYFSRAPDERRTLTDGYSAVYVTLGDQMVVTGITFEDSDSALLTAITEAFPEVVVDAAV